MNLEEIVKELVHNGITVTMYLNNTTGDIEYDLNVHLKSGIKLKESIDGDVVALTRHKEEVVNEIGDILRIYLYWFEDAQKRLGNWVMSSVWEQLMIKHEIIQVESQMVVSKTYKRT